MCGNPELVYDAARDGFEWGLPAVSALVVGLSLYRVRRAQRKSPGQQHWSAALILGFAVLIPAFAFYGAVKNYRDGRAERVSGGYETIEGVVEKFVPQPWAGHDLERFDVAGVHFFYSDYKLSSGFHQSHSHGGPIAPGVHARIGHLGNTILSLEICH